MEETLDSILATIPEGYGFCIRDDDEYGYMANITTPDFVNDPDIDASKKQSFPVWNKSLHEALRQSIAKARKAMA